MQEDRERGERGEQRERDREIQIAHTIKKIDWDWDAEGFILDLVIREGLTKDMALGLESVVEKPDSEIMIKEKKSLWMCIFF